MSKCDDCAIQVLSLKLPCLSCKHNAGFQNDNFMPKPKSKYVKMKLTVYDEPARISKKDWDNMIPKTNKKVVISKSCEKKFYGMSLPLTLFGFFVIVILGYLLFVVAR